MTNVGEHLYSYDVPAVDKEGKPINVDLVIFHASKGKQTWESTFNDNCIGDTAYVKDDIYGMFRLDESGSIPACGWRANPTMGAHLKVDTQGKVLGWSLLDNETPADVVDRFIADYQLGMLEEKVGYDNPDLISEENRSALISEIIDIIDEHNPDQNMERSIGFEIPEAFRVDDNKYYVHLWNSSTGESVYEWQSTSELMTIANYSETLATYEMPAGDWDMMVVSNSAGKKTFESVIDPRAIGKYFTVKKGMMDYSTIDFQEGYDVVWLKDTSKGVMHDYCSTHRQIVLGCVTIDVMGNAHLVNETDETIFNDFRNEYGPKEDGSSRWYNGDMNYIYNMSWDEAEKYVAKLLDVGYLLDDFDYAKEYGIKKGLPVVDGMEIPERYSTDFKIENGEVPTDWDGYYDVYYFDAPEEWVTENKDKKLDGYDIGVYWYGFSSTDDVIYSGKYPGVPAKKLSVLDENGNDIYANSNIYYAFVPTFAEAIMWNNGIADNIENYYEYFYETDVIKLKDPILNNLADKIYYEDMSVDGADISGCLMYTTGEYFQPGGITGSPYENRWLYAFCKYFDPVTGETTEVPLKNEKGEFVTKPDKGFNCDKVALNPYYDMDYTYTKEETPTDKPTEAPTSSATTATSNPTTAPTTPTTNNANGTVNTSQSSAVAVLALIFTASLGIVFVADKKRKQSN